MGTPLGGGRVGDSGCPAIRLEPTRDKARTGPRGRQGRPLGPPKRVFTVITPRLSPAAPRPLGSEDEKRVTRRDKFSVSPAKKGDKGQSITTTLVPPNSGPSSSTHSVDQRERVSTPDVGGSAGPALRPPPRASIGHLRRAKAHASLVAAREAELESAA